MVSHNFIRYHDQSINGQSKQILNSMHWLFAVHFYYDYDVLVYEFIKWNPYTAAEIVPFWKNVKDEPIYL